MTFLHSLSELSRGLLFLHGHVVTPRALDTLAPTDGAAAAPLHAPDARPPRSRPGPAPCDGGTSVAGCA
ncbi:hypothetical protein [Coralloluteibacterium stylophorae]|uniref:Uncharacterized protein n=1 Tax=Coralloluteibacterium stylophorae TaxID=1776034 RepID=A0A8J7VSF0_9GAMM|nr:hypothetical protein [Coralloluteibacterium stylophorae]MBS7458141.1 hypothetical protein [Coralloluteibacterium stylophorae]